ncbi:MAG: HlyD family efflux transporter periplasmic adaptor subunit [Rhodoferax sp.]|nr:HlyD family efflux transporter periplasmic adaptor subunit [Rhodoferax sp.]
MNKQQPQKKWRRWLVGAALLVAASALAYVAYRPRPIDVEVATVRMDNFEQAIEEDGQLRLKNRYVIAAPTSAALLRPTLKVGDLVRAGDAVATLVPVAPQMIDARTRTVLQQRVGSADAARQAAAAQVLKLQAALAQATLEAQRAEQLAQANFIAPSARDQANLARQTAQEALNVARAEQSAADFALAEARAALSRSEPSAGTPAAGVWTLNSPVNGQVLKLHQDSATTVTGGQPLLDIGDTGALEAVIDVLSSEALQIRVGAAVQLSAGGSAKPLSGRVSRIEPAAFTKVSALGIEEQRVNVIVDLDAREAQRLGDGFRVDARILVFSQADALLVPTAALVRQGEQWRVFVVDSNRAAPRQVQWQERNTDVTWIKEGLKAGDTVVLYPGSMVEGQPVRQRKP